jgi:hypothetical protein
MKELLVGAVVCKELSFFASLYLRHFLLYFQAYVRILYALTGRLCLGGFANRHSYA